MDKILETFWSKKDSLIFSQIVELINDNVLTISETMPVIVREENSDKVTMQQAIKLSFRGREILDSLKKENKLLRDEIDQLREKLI